MSRDVTERLPFKTWEQAMCAKMWAAGLYVFVAFLALVWGPVLQDIGERVERIEKRWDERQKIEAERDDYWSDGMIKKRLKAKELERKHKK